MRLVGAVTTDGGTPVGSSNCTITTGNVNEQLLQLVVDGQPVEPSGAPNEIVEANATVALDLYWPIPLDVETLAIRAEGRDGPSDESSIIVPDVVPVDGD